MTKSAAVSSGASWMFLTQILIFTGQFIYTFFTARMFAPQIFGAFTVALSLQGIFLVISSSGIPAHVLGLKSINAIELRSLRLSSLFTSVVSSTLFLLLFPIWVSALKGPQCTYDFAPALAGALFISPFASLENALVRRLGLRKHDAFSNLAAFLLATLVALVCAFSTRLAFSLAILTIAIPGFSLIISLALLRTRRIVELGGLNRVSKKFILQVSLQNLGFLMLNQVPVWALSILSGPTALGFFTRATVLTQLPSNNFSEAVNRPLQPMWRHLQDEATFLKAMFDVIIVSCSLSFFFFGTVFAVGPSFTLLWLGSGWKIAAALVQPLAVLGAIHLPYSVATKALEIAKLLRVVRRSQYLGAATLLAGVTLFLVIRDIQFFAWSLAAAEFVSLFSVLLFLRSKRSGQGFWHLKVLLTTTAWSIVNSFLAIGLVYVVSQTNLPRVNEIALFTGGIAAVGFYMVTFRLQPARDILVTRGIRFPSSMGRVLLGTRVQRVKNHDES
jgi:lipopolysaccharide exporter